MGAKLSTANGGSQSPRTRAFSTSSSTEVVTPPGFRFMRSLGMESDRQRARSLSSVPDLHGNSGTESHRAENGGPNLGEGSMAGSPGADTDSSAGDEGAQGGFIGHAAAAALTRVYAAHSLPGHIWSLNGIKCPVCSKFVVPDDIECHLVMCLTKPRLSYNEDVLTDDKGECVICLEELSQGDVIARLPCLCIYHKTCIDQWFEVNRSCPEHPGD
ncbi:E3 ubiquitin-protein ligase ZNRF1 [Rhynchophorus ferrugineus]|uniref:E3 ubiquitin-protein ligase ZNRF1 n=1 Tax=Rhynchophorus ferrugineus TaxID=354439 RepID=UPI003FCD7863